MIIRLNCFVPVSCELRHGWQLGVVHQGANHKAVAAVKKAHSNAHVPRNVEAGVLRYAKWLDSPLHLLLHYGLRSVIALVFALALSRLFSRSLSASVLYLLKEWFLDLLRLATASACKAK